MGISFSPGGAQWDHYGYAMFRRRLAALDGIDLDQMRGFTPSPLPRDWEDYPTALEPLLNSSDVHGFISSENCQRMLPRLCRISAQWTSELTVATAHEEYDLWKPGLVRAGRFGAYCTRVLALTGKPRNLAEKAIEADFWGIGVIVNTATEPELVVAPTLFEPFRHTPAAWAFAEAIYAQVAAQNSVGGVHA